MSSSFHRISCLFILCLTTWTACGDAFQTPYCDYFADQKECLGAGKDLGAMPSPDMQQGMTQPVPDMTPRMKDPVGFTFATNLAINPNLDWVGIHQGDRLVFAQKDNSDAKIIRYMLKFSTTGWNLDRDNCSNCLKTIEHFDFSKDYIVTSNSLFYKISPGSSGASEYIFDQENPIFSYIAMNQPIAGYRPFAHCDIDHMIFQLGQSSPQGAMSGSALFHQQVLGDGNFSITYDRSTFTNEKYLTYCTGDLNQLRTSLHQQEILIFEESACINAYRIQSDQSNKYSLINDNNLKDSVNSLREKINDKFSINSDKLIRSVYISDLNNDKYADLLIGILNAIYVATYSPETGTFILWKDPIVTLSNNERPRSISVSDLNGDSYPDLAIEIFKSGTPDYRNELPDRVGFYINLRK